MSGFIGGHNGEFILEQTVLEGLESDFVRTVGESRICIAIVDPIQKTQTELNEVGPEITADELSLLKAKFENLVSTVDYVVISGSTPPGVPDDIYKDLIGIANRYGTRCVLDASGLPLAEGIDAVPYMVKPNIHELSTVLGRQLATIEEAVDAASELNQRGIEIVVVTFGRDGAIAVTRDSAWRAIPPDIRFVSAVGSGDSFAAAFVYALESGRSIPDALRLGTGAGAANAMTFGAGFCKRDDILRLAEESELVVMEIGKG